MAEQNNSDREKNFADFRMFEKTFAPPYNRNMLYVHTDERIYDLNVSSINVKELTPYLKQIAGIKGIQFISKKR